MNTAALLATLEVALPIALQLVAQLVSMIKGLGGNTATLEASVREMEARIPGLINEVKAFQVERHPEDTGA